MLQVGMSCDSASPAGLKLGSVPPVNLRSPWIVPGRLCIGASAVAQGRVQGHDVSSLQP